MNRADVLWELLERADRHGPTPIHVTWHDVEAWEADTLEWLELLGLIREVSSAEMATCIECLDLHIERVHYRRLAGGELLALLPCPANGLVRLDPVSLRRWQIDLPAFAATVARSSLMGNWPREVMHQRCWQLSARDGGPTFLARGALWPDSPRVFAGALTFPRNSRLLHLSALSPSFKLANGDWYPLSQVFDAVELRLDFDSMDDSGDPAFELRRTGRFWVLRFEKGTASVPDRKGFSYLRILLAAPSRAFSALELASAYSGPGSSTQFVAEKEGLSVADGYGDEEVIDDEYRKQLQDHISQLNAKKNARGLSADEDKELNDLRQHLRAGTDLGGRSRRTPREGEKARVSVTNAISRALDEVSKVLPDMEKHLRIHITTGAAFCYEGDGVVSWSLPENDVVTSHVTS